jgi:hypothetical protein
MAKFPWTNLTLSFRLKPARIHLIPALLVATGDSRFLFFLFSLVEPAVVCLGSACNHQGPCCWPNVVPAALWLCRCACAVVSSLSALTLFFLPRQRRFLREPPRSRTRLTAHEPTTSRPRCGVAFLRRWPRLPSRVFLFPSHSSFFFWIRVSCICPCSLT